MSAGQDSNLTPEAAAAEIERTGRLVRGRARWPGWVWFGVAVVNFGFFVGVGTVDRTVSQALTPLPIVVIVVIFVVAARQLVVGRHAGRINKPVALAAVVGLVLLQTVVLQGFTGWLVGLAAVMVAPYLVGAWRWLHS